MSVSITHCQTLPINFTSYFSTIVTDKATSIIMQPRSFDEGLLHFCRLAKVLLYTTTFEIHHTLRLRSG
jgi:hypothetical protein